MLKGFCTFCGEMSILQQSHAIPDSIFRMILRTSGGAAIAIPSDDRKIHRSNDTGKAYILCKNCESDFNKKWDAPLVNCLKILDKKIKIEGFSARQNFCHHQFAQAIVGIVWRACVSESEYYIGSKISKKHTDKLKVMLYEEKGGILKNVSLSIRRLCDKRTKDESGFDQIDTSQIIYPPTPRTYFINGKPKGFGFEMVILGFLIHLIVPRLPYHKMQSSGFLRKNGTIIHAPPINIFDYQPLLDMLMVGMKKHLDGHMTNAVKRN